MSRRDEYGHFICGAETASGLECSRRLYRGEERCFQHSGWRAEQRADRAAKRPSARAAAGEVKLTLWVNPQIGEYLEHLVATGLYGEDRNEAAKRLIESGIGAMIAPFIGATRRRRRR